MGRLVRVVFLLGLVRGLVVLRLRGLGRFRVGRRLGHLRRTRGQHQFDGSHQVGVGDLRLAGQRGRGPGQRQGLQRCAQRRDPEARGNLRKARDGRIGDGDLRQKTARLHQGIGVELQVGGIAQGDIGQVEVDGQPVGEAFGNTLLGAGALVERHQRQRHAIVERLGEPGGKARLGAFGHGQNQDAGALQKARRPRHMARPQRRGEVDPAEERLVPDIRVEPGHALPPQAKVERGEKPFAHRTHTRPQPDPAKGGGIEGETGEREACPLPGFLGVGAHASTSSTVRVTRVVVPASSSGSRRRR